MNKKVIAPLAVISVLASTTAAAAVSDAEIEALRMQLAAVSQRLDELAAENAALRRAQADNTTAIADVKASALSAESPTGAMAKADWPGRIRFDGDFRFRHEAIDAEGSSTRRRDRIRARTNIKASIADNAEIGFGLATGSDDPVSTNQTLGGGGSSKTIVLNLAYVDWEISDGLNLLLGKFKNPLARAGKHDLIWDSDWTPEGFALSYAKDWYFANVLGSQLESDSRKSNASFGWGLQLGASGELGDTTITGGVAYYSFKTRGDVTTFGDASDPDDYFGNSAIEFGGLPCGTTPGADCAYVNDYLLTEVFAEASFDFGEWPAQVFVDYVKNSDPSDNNTGWAAGARFGQARDHGEVQFGYSYTDKEADAVLGLLTGSDFGGGGTDNKGHLLQVNYGVNKNLTIGASYFINETAISSDSEQDYDRLMLDAQWKWK